MLRTRHFLRSVTDFMAVHRDTRALQDVQSQNEPLCLYAILKHGFLAPHPWQDIKESSRTPAVQLLTATTAPRLFVTYLSDTGKLVPETTIAAMLATDLTVWGDLPEPYKTPGLRELYQKLTVVDTKYHWGLGTVGV